MTEYLFYHLERARAEDVVPSLLEKTLQRGWRAVVRLPDEDALRRLDEHLWTYRDESFLPHAAGAPDPLDPVWLTAGELVPDGVDLVMSLVPAAFEPSGFGGLTRAILLFAEEEAPAARDAWKRVKAAGGAATYWRQDSSGSWGKAG